jgi:hypothetical protein
MHEDTKYRTGLARNSIINNKKAATIALILTLTIAATLLTLPVVNAHDPPWTVPVFTYITAGPDPIGVNQQLVILFWSDGVVPTAAGAYGDRWTYNVEITKPDGTKETLGPITSDPVGGGYSLYTPTQVGTYTFVAHRDEHTLTGLPLGPGETIDTIRGAETVNDTYLASSSNPTSVTVQEDPIETWEEAPLPTEFWTRPINQLSREWYTLAGNWFGRESAAHDSGWTVNGNPRLIATGPGPESPHVMWTRPIYAGGIMDARYGTHGYPAVHYQGLKLLPPIIIQGKLIYDNFNTGHSLGGWWVVDLYTGETLDFFNTSTLTTIRGRPGEHGIPEFPSFATIYDYGSPNQHGGYPYLWKVSGVTLPEGYITEPGKQTWEMLDAYAFGSVTKIANVSDGGFRVYGKEGSILRYSLDTKDGVQYLRVWNSSAIPTLLAGISGSNVWQWMPYRLPVHDGNQAWSLNVSISPPVQGDILAVREGEFVIGGTEGKNNGTYIEEGVLWALSLEPGKEGTLLWSINFTPPETVVPDIKPHNQKHRIEVGLKGVDPESGVFIFSEAATLRRWGYSMETGERLWGPTEPEPAMNWYDNMPDLVYEGKLISYGLSGVVTAYNITTGDIIWKYTAKGVGYESPFINDPLSLNCIADGKLYFTSSQHSPQTPLWRGSYLRCINASNGAELWKISNWGNAIEAQGQGKIEGGVIADGFFVGLNLYDAQIYCIGKGPSATTVTGPETTIPLGEEVLIKGAVTDVCAGAKQLVEEGKLDMIPAISDADQQAWMEYLYEDQGMPTNAEGVEVVITTLDPNGNTYELARTTTDMSGTFGCAVDPPVPGKYKIMATFEGSDSYYGSSATTYINVGEAPSPAQPIEPESTGPESTEPTEPEPTGPKSTEPTEPTEPEPTEPEPTEPEPTEPAEAPLITTETAIIAAVIVAVIIGIAAYWQLRKRK